MSEFPAAFRFALACGLAMLLSGCSPLHRAPGNPAKGMHSEQMEEHGPFARDRMLVVESLSRVKKRHQQAHQVLAPLLLHTDLPSCAGHREVHRCPLLAQPWRFRSIPGGVQLALRISRTRAELLGQSIRCHNAFGRRFDRREDICILQNPAVSVASRYKDGRLVVSITTTDPSFVDELRRRIHALVRRPR